MIKVIPIFITKKIFTKLDLYNNRDGLGKGYFRAVREIFKRNWKYAIILILLSIIECIVNIPFLVIRVLCYIPYKIYEKLWE